MIGLDTNVLARYYIDDDADAEAQHQRPAARRLIDSGQPLMVSKSVILEPEWVMRGYYSFGQSEVASVSQHLLEQPHVVVEDREAVGRALSSCRAGIDFAPEPPPHRAVGSRISPVIARDCLRAAARSAAGRGPTG